MKYKYNLLVLVMASLHSVSADEAIDKVILMRGEINIITDQENENQQSNITCIFSAIDNLPNSFSSISNNFVSDDWSTIVSIDNLQPNLNQQQIKITINGEKHCISNYGDGVRLNSYIDTDSLYKIDIFQGLTEGFSQ